MYIHFYGFEPNLTFVLGQMLMCKLWKGEPSKSHETYDMRLRRRCLDIL